MPTVAYVPRSALAICLDSLAASAGWADDVQMPGAARAGTGAARAGTGAARAGTAVARAAAAPGLPAGLEVPAGAGAAAGPGAPAGPWTSKAASTHASAGHRRHRRIVITLLGGSADDSG